MPCAVHAWSRAQTDCDDTVTRAPTPLVSHLLNRTIVHLHAHMHKHCPLALADSGLRRRACRHEIDSSCLLETIKPETLHILVVVGGLLYTIGCSGERILHRCECPNVLL